MNVVNFNDKICEKVRRYFDSYLDNELLVETNHEVLRHVAACADCARILEERGRLKKAVKQAVMKEQAPPALIEDIRKTIRETKTTMVFARDLRRWGMAVAALLILAVGGVVMLRTIDFDQARTILGIGLADHVHCTLELGKWKELISFEHMKEATGSDALGPEFIDLVPLAKEKLGSDFQLVQGHRCTLNGRDYVHLIATGRNGAILSLIITRKNDEAFPRARLAAAIQASGVSIYHDNQANLEIAGFETNHFLAFVASNLDREGNLKVASTLAPSIYQFLQRP